MDAVIGVGSFIITNAPQLVGFAMPPLVEVLNKDVHGKTERVLVTLFACFFAALLLKWNDLLYGSAEDVFTSAGLIFGESQVMFKLYFENSWLRWKIQSGLEETEEIG